MRCLSFLLLSSLAILSAPTLSTVSAESSSVAVADSRHHAHTPTGVAVSHRLRKLEREIEDLLDQIEEAQDFADADADVDRYADAASTNEVDYNGDCEAPESLRTKVVEGVMTAAAVSVAVPVLAAGTAMMLGTAAAASVVLLPISAVAVAADVFFKPIGGLYSEDTLTGQVGSAIYDTITGRRQRDEEAEMDDAEEGEEMDVRTNTPRQTCVNKSAAARQFIARLQAQSKAFVRSHPHQRFDKKKMIALTPQQLKAAVNKALGTKL